jgi:hypothetical protein
MGEVLGKITEVCLAEGATPIFAHHTVKHAGTKAGRNGASFKSYEPAELGDLAFAGFAEFARQWLLIARREDYEPGTGEHRLWVTTGGSAGFNGCYAVDVDEGVMREDFTGKHWEVRVQTQAEAARSRVTARASNEELKIQEDRPTVLNAVGRLGASGVSANELEANTPFGRKTVDRHLAALQAAHSIEVCGRRHGGNLWRATCWNNPVEE